MLFVPALNTPMSVLRTQEFGNCPHFLCRGQPVVPLGVRDEPHMETVKLFCPKCQDVYVHPSHAAQSEFAVAGICKGF